MPIRHVPYWLDRFPRTRRPSHPRLKGSIETTVAIVGGGLTGSACAWSFAAAGVSVVLVEAESIGAGATAAATGLVRQDFDASFAATASAHGLRAARLLWQAMRKASLEFAAASRRLSIKCDLAPEDMVLFARDAPAARLLQREYQARRDAGLDHTWIKPGILSRETGIETGGGIRTRGFSVDPYRACLGFASAAASRGALLYERSPVRRIRAGRKQVEIVTSAGSIRADAVLVATSSPIQDLRALRRHLDARHSYSLVTEPLPSTVRREVGRRAAALQDSDAPPHVLRWLKQDRILFSGAEQPQVPDRLREKVIVQRTGQLMYELSVLYPAISGLQPEWAWDVTQYETVDRLPFVGFHRNFPRHLFAMGASRHGAGVAWLAARTLLRQYGKVPAKGDDLFGFSRVL
jgi:glycine/D-amino acid oxidase-like deaminating enzyme